MTPLFLASRESKDTLKTVVRNESGHLQILRILLEDQSIDVNLEVNFKTALMIAAELGNEKALSLLLKNDQIHVNLQNSGDGKSALIFAAEQGRHIAVKILLHSHQIDPNVLDFYGESALRKTSLKGYLGVFKLLIRCPKTEVPHDVQIEFVDSLDKDEEGTFVTHKEILEAINFQSFLLQKNNTCCHDVDKNLLQSAKNGNHREVHGLLQCPDSNINVQNMKGYTALHIASKLNHYRVIDVLLKNHLVDTNRGVLIDGATAFSIASVKSHFQIEGLLIKHEESDVNKGWCDNSWTPGITKCLNIIKDVPKTKKPLKSAGYLVIK